MGNFMILFKKDLLELKRSKKWLVYILTISFITLFSVISARLLPEILNLFLVETGLDEVFTYRPSVADSYVQFISNVGQIIWILIAIMFSNTLVKEKVSGTYYMLKSNGVSETKIVLSHFLSKLLLITISYLVSIAIFVPLNLVLFKEYAGLRGVIALSYLYLSLIFALCFALFISSCVKKKNKGIIFVIAIYFILSILVMFPYIDIYNPLYNLTLASNVIMYKDNKTSEYLINLFTTIGYCIVFIISSMYLFKNKINNGK